MEGFSVAEEDRSDLGRQERVVANGGRCRSALMVVSS